MNGYRSRVKTPIITRVFMICEFPNSPASYGSIAPAPGDQAGSRRRRQDKSPARFSTNQKRPKKQEKSSLSQRGSAYYNFTSPNDDKAIFFAYLFEKNITLSVKESCKTLTHQLVSGNFFNTAAKSSPQYLRIPYDPFFFL